MTTGIDSGGTRGSSILLNILPAGMRRSGAKHIANELLALQSAVAAAHGDFEAVMSIVAASALRVIPSADGAVVGTLELDGSLVVRAATGSAEHLLGQHVGAEITGRAIVLGAPHLYDDIVDEPWFHDSPGDLRSLMIVPVPHIGDYAGFLSLRALRPHAFDETDLLAAQLLAGPLALGIAGRVRADAGKAQENADRRFVATFEQAAVGMAHVAPDGSFLLLNDRFCEIAGYSREELHIGGFQQITHPDDLDTDLGHLHDLIAGRVSRYAMEKRYIRRDGTIIWVNLTVSLVRAPDGAPEFFVSVIEDISARKIAETAARSDALTGVLNRRGLIEELDRLLVDQQGSDRSLAVILLDLNGFKAVNDQYGHAEGDLCLAAVSASIERVIRRHDRLARLGGDEFVLLMPLRASDQTDVAPVLDRLRAAIADACSDMPWTVSASIGALVVGGDSIKGACEVIAAADRLMYDAKRSADRQEMMFII